MKVVILAGGLGSRLSEETITKPKPLVEIGGKPILWHIMKYYSSYGHNEFIICCGYKGHLIKDFFSNYHIYNSVVDIDLSNSVHNKQPTKESWKISLVDTGENSMTGGRLKKIYKYVKDEEYVAMTYGDGLSNINIDKLEDHHKKMNKLATVSAVKPQPRFGYLNINKSGIVSNFEEKADLGNNYINGGFFIIDPICFKDIKSDSISWEKQPMENLAKKRQLTAFIHNGFWQPMDTLRDKNYLESLWDRKKALWRIW